LVDGLARLVHGLRELLVALLGVHALCEGAAEAGDDRNILSEVLARLGAVIASRQGDDADCVRVRHQRQIEVRLSRQRQLEHDTLTGRQLPQALHQTIEEKPLALLLVGGLDVDLGLQHRHEALRQDLPAHLELLLHNRLNARDAGPLDHRALLRAEDARRHRLVQQGIQRRHLLHELHAVFLLLQALVDLQEGHHLLVLPQVLRRRLPTDLAVHGGLEEDGSDCPLAVELWIGDDAGPHLVHLVVHLLISRILGLVDAVQLEGLGRAAAALVQRRQESILKLDLAKLRFHAALHRCLWLLHCCTDGG